MKLWFRLYLYSWNVKSYETGEKVSKIEQRTAKCSRTR